MESDALRGEIMALASKHFRSKGFDETTMDDICDDLDIDNETFCRYFRDLDELLEAVWSEL